MIGVEGDYDPLLKRPLSILRGDSSKLSFLYRIRGRGTGLLRNMGQGTVIDLLGPLGNAYPLPEFGKIPLLVAGGVGIASLFPLAERLGKDSRLFYGARTGRDLLLLEEIRDFTSHICLATDDGSEGEKGSILGVLIRFLDKEPAGADKYVVYACGPSPMLRALSETADARGIQAYLSMEEHMACGIGACLGCVVKTVNGHQRVCAEGPVFPAEEIVW